MDKRFSINNIAEMLSEKTGGAVADNEKFIRVLIAVINEGIMRDQIVKIKGIGTFKVVLVKERESIHVNTGERIVIPSHHKLSFIPEKALKDLINKPFASFDTIEALEEEKGLMSFSISETERAGEDEQEIKEEEIQANVELPPVIGVSDDSVETNENLINERQMLSLETSLEQRMEETLDEEAKGEEVLPEKIIYNEPPIPLNEKQQMPGIETSVEQEVEEIQDEELNRDEILPEEIVYNEPPIHLSDSEIINQIRKEAPAPLSPPPPPTLTSQPPSPHPPSPPRHTGKGRRKRKSKRSSIKLLLTILFLLIFILIGGGIWYVFFHSKPLDEFYSGKLGSQITEEKSVTLPTDSVTSDKLIGEVNPALDTTAHVQAGVNETEATETEASDTVSSPVSEPPATVSQPTTATPQSATEKQPTTSRPATATATPSTSSGQANTTATSPTASRPPTTTSPQTTTASTGNNVLARVRVEPGQRLTLIAEKYYGLKVFWVYIYEYNKAKIGSDPNRIATGMEILVPSKEMYGIDANSASSVEKATALQTRIMSGY